MDLASRSRTTGPIKIVGVGNLVRWKNWHLLIKALAQLDEALRNQIHISIWGPELDEPDAKAYAAELKALIHETHTEKHVSLEGPTHSVQEKITSADLFALPSTNEPCSVALMEALALGVPAIVSKSGGNIDIVKDGETGLFFEPDNANSLSATLARIVESNTCQFSSPEEIRESVRHRCASKVWSAYEAIYENLLSKP